MFRRNRGKKNGQLAIVPDERGFAVVDIQYHDDQAHLQHCEFTPWQNDRDHEAVVTEKGRQLGLKRRRCTTVIPSGQYSIFGIDSPHVPDEELAAAVRWQIKDLIDFNIEDACIEVFPAPSGSGIHQKKQLYVVVSEESTIREQAALIRSGQVDLETIDIPELALRNIAALLPESNAGIIMVYLTEQRGMVVISRHGKLYFARTMEIGSDTLTQSLPTTGLSLTGDSAFDHLVLEIQRSLDYYDRYFSQPPVAGIVFTPMPREISGLFEHIRNSLDLPVRQLQLDEFMTIDNLPDQEQQARCLIAIGAALRQTA